MVSSSIQSRCDLNIYDVTPIKDIRRLTMPVLFLHGVLRGVTLSTHFRLMKILLHRR